MILLILDIILMRGMVKLRRLYLSSDENEVLPWIQECVLEAVDCTGGVQVLLLCADTHRSVDDLRQPRDDEIPHPELELHILPQG